MSKILTFIGAIVFFGIGSLASPSLATRGPYEWSMIDLDYVLLDKVVKLRVLLENAHTLAKKAANDEVVQGVFKVNKAYYELTARRKATEDFKSEVYALRKSFDMYYIENYFSFYDILFIDADGETFYTIRKESDINQNLLTGKASNTSLGNMIRDKPTKELFVDYDRYLPSADPAAFFIEPIFIEGTLAGWIALQLPINKINAMFTSTSGVDNTLETFLVNKNGMMLTESHFEGSSTILKKRLDDKNVRAKYNSKKGHAVITDYRGVEALSSFEVVEFMGVKWLVVVKVDKDEITTKEYKMHKLYYADKMQEYMNNISCPQLKRTQHLAQRIATRVDMDEFGKAACGEKLETWGISTCTGLLAAFPGRFGYLAHISNKDMIYGGEETNLLGQITKSIERFDVSQNEKRKIFFLIVTLQRKSTIKIIDELIDRNFFLSQIYLISCPQAKSSGVFYDCEKNEAIITWKMPDEEFSGAHHLGEAINLGNIMEKIVNVQR